MTSRSPLAPQPGRPVRRDAERNYQRILDAAREVFGELGADASIEEIAGRAGVGIGTVYRRFASKDALIDELLRLSMLAVQAIAEAALAAPAADGLAQFLYGCGQELAEHARYAELLLARPADPAIRARIQAAIGELTARAVAAGAADARVTVGDVMALIWGLRGVVLVTSQAAPDAWRRYLSLHLAGLRSPGALDGTPAPLSAAQLSALISLLQFRYSSFVTQSVPTTGGRGVCGRPRGPPASSRAVVSMRPDGCPERNQVTHERNEPAGRAG